MFRNSIAAGLVSLSLGLGASDAALAAPAAMTGCFDPAVAAAIDAKERKSISENRMPGSGLALNSLPALAGTRITAHQIEIRGGQSTGDPNIAICLVKMHVTARTPEGVKAAEEDFTYRIERPLNDLTVTFCPNRQCPPEASPVTLKTSQIEQTIR